jgi:hypothetical protein
MAITYTLISSVTVGSSGAADIEFTSIPTTYTDLLLRFSPRSANSTYGGFNLYMNTNTNRFGGIFLSVDGSSGSSGTTNELFLPLSSWTSNTFGNVDLYFHNYQSSTTKTLLAEGAAEANTTDVKRYVSFFAYSLADNNAINKLTLSMFGGDKFAQYSTAYLYGIS